jgi:hypothetical protein
MKQGATNQLSISPTERAMYSVAFAGAVYENLAICGLAFPASRCGESARSKMQFRARPGVKAGDVNIGVQTTHSERVSPIISIVLIAGGIALTCPGSEIRETLRNCSRVEPAEMRKCVPCPMHDWAQTPLPWVSDYPLQPSLC